MRPDTSMRPLRLAILALLLAVLAAPLAAQTVRGVVVEVASGRPVDGMVVSLHPRGGAAIAGGLTDAAGRFSLAAPEPGAYTVRAERVGYRPAWADVQLHPGDSPEVRLQTAVQAFVLDPVQVTADRRCLVRPGAGELAYELWQQAAVALRATALAQEQELVQYTVRTYERQLLGVRQRGRNDVARRVTGNPFHTLSPAALAERGYLREGRDSLSFYGPDARALLSDEFLDTHCLYAEAGAPGELGVAFEPADDRGIVDIRGTLWLDAHTGELRRVEYKYTGLTDDPRGAPAGGRIEFRRLRSGAWIVGRWHIRVARMEMDNRRQQNGVVADLREAGGEVTDVTVVGQERAQ